MIATTWRSRAAMAEAVTRNPDLELQTQALSIATFRFVPADLRSPVGDKDEEAYLNRLNEALLDAIQRGGEAFVSNAVVAGRYTSARLHRELPHNTRRCRGNSGDCGPPGPGTRCPMRPTLSV